MKRRVLSVLLVLMLLTTAGALAEPARLGVVTPDADHGFTAESIEHAKAELAYQEVLLGTSAFAYRYDVGDTAALQSKAIDEQLAWGAEVILLWPVEGEQLREAAQRVVDAGVGLIVYDRLIDGFEGLDAEAMGDNDAIGREMGDYVLAYFADRLAAGETLQYLMFIGDESTVTDQRGGCMLAQFESSPYAAQLVRKGEPFITDWSRDKAQAQMTDWLATASADEIAEIDFIITHDDEIVDGLLLALADAPMENLRLLTGVGGRRETLDALENNALGIDWVTYFFSPSFTREAVRLAVCDLLDKPYQDQVIEGQQFLIPTFEIDAESLAAFRESTIYLERYGLTN